MGEESFAHVAGYWPYVFIFTPPPGEYLGIFAPSIDLARLLAQTLIIVLASFGSVIALPPKSAPN